MDNYNNNFDWKVLCSNYPFYIKNVTRALIMIRGTKKCSTPIYFVSVQFLD